MNNERGIKLTQVLIKPLFGSTCLIHDYFQDLRRHDLIMGGSGLVGSIGLAIGCIFTCIVPEVVS